jgi:phosphatidylglycerol:prolipoprotein diacylglycerol transferase
MHPVLFRIPGLDFPLRTFGALVACGILLGIWVWGRLLVRHGDDPVKDPERASQAALWVVVGVLVGARLFYVGVELTRYLSADLGEAQRAYLAADDRGAGALAPEELEEVRRVSVGHDFLHDPFKILLIWQGGLVMYGGLIGGILLGLHGARKHGLDPWNGLDTGLLGGFVGLAIGRIGCLMVGDDYGRIVPASHEDSWRPIGFDWIPSPVDGPANPGELGPLTLRVPDLEWLTANPESLFDKDLAGKVLWATQPWMSLNALLIALAGLLWLRLRRRYGVPAALMLMQYAVCRFAIEMFRGDEVRGVWFGGKLSTSQIVSVVLLGLGAWMLVKRRAAPALVRRSPHGP